MPPSYARAGRKGRQRPAPPKYTKKRKEALSARFHSNKGIIQPSEKSASNGNETVIPFHLILY